MKNRIAIALIICILGTSLCACASGTADQAPAAAEENAPAAEENAPEAEEPAAAETEGAETPEAGDAAPAGTEDETAAAKETPAAEEPAAAETEGAEPAAEETVTAEAGDVLPAFTLNSYSDSETEDGRLTAGCSYETVQLTEEAAIEYASLNKFLEAENDEIRTRCKKTYEEIEEAAEDLLEEMGNNTENFPAGEIESRIEAVRCDGEVLSLLETCYTFYPGAAHGMTGFTGYNYNTVSGEPVELADVIADTSALLPAISENLTAMADGSAITGVDEQLEFAFGEGFDNLTWVLDRDGITAYFAPSDIAAYAVGPLEARISFDKYPFLFTGKYKAATGKYVRKIPPYAKCMVDLDSDGQAEAVSVTAADSEDNDIFSNSLEVAVDDQVCTVEERFSSIEAYLAHTEDGRNYIYAEVVSDNDYPILKVFEIKDKKATEIGEMSGTGFTSVYHMVMDDDGELDEDESYAQCFPMIDPDHFALGTRTDLMSTYSAYRFYEIGSDGMPVPLTDYYEINAGIVLTSRMPLKAEVVDVDTAEGTGKEMEIPAGTRFTLWHTNGEDTVDLMTEDGTAVRFNVDKDGTQTVNGIELEEAFDGVRFAG